MQTDRFAERRAAPRMKRDKPAKLYRLEVLEGIPELEVPGMRVIHRIEQDGSETWLNSEEM